MCIRQGPPLPKQSFKGNDSMSKTDSKPYGDDTEAVLQARKYTQANGLPDPYRAYCLHRSNSRIRGIEWGFTFTAWWAIWQPYFHMRGRGTNGLCMARELDDGPYSPDNVYLTTNLGNIQDYHRKSAKAAESRKLAKEKREMRFARQGTTHSSGRSEFLSHVTFKAHNTSKSTCNVKEDGLELELSTP